MKTRRGFITNSSSTAYVIHAKRDMTQDELREKMESVFALPDDHPLAVVAEEVVAVLMQGLEEGLSRNAWFGDLYSSCYDTIESWMYNHLEIEYEDDDVEFIVPRYWSEDDFIRNRYELDDLIDEGAVSRGDSGEWVFNES